MKNKFTLGVIAGMSTLSLAVPVLAQMTSAQMADQATIQTSSAPADKPFFFEKRAPDTTQAGVQTMIDHDTKFLANIDAMTALQKTAIQARITALTAAASITDDTQRAEAVKAAHEAYRSAIEAAVTANPDLKAAMNFGGPGAPGGHGFMMHHGRGPGDLAEKLGMTEDELKAELDGGKTIEDIATEKGVTLPARPEKGMMKMGQPAAQ